MEYSETAKDFVEAWVCPHTGVPGFKAAMQHDLDRLIFKEKSEAEDKLRDAVIAAQEARDKTDRALESTNLQISEERERCAKIVEGKIPIGGPRGMASLVLLTHIAKEIRAGVPLKPKHESEER